MAPPVRRPCRPARDRRAEAALAGAAPPVRGTAPSRPPAEPRCVGDARGHRAPMRTVRGGHSGGPSGVRVQARRAPSRWPRARPARAGLLAAADRLRLHRRPASRPASARGRGRAPRRVGDGPVATNLKTLPLAPRSPPSIARRRRANPHTRRRPRGSEARRSPDAVRLLELAPSRRASGRPKRPTRSCRRRPSRRGRRTPSSLP